jgi:hypothetical protein
MSQAIAQDQEFAGCGASSRTDKLVLTTVNAPYKRNITAADLAECLVAASVEGWPSHVVSFFTEVKAALVLGFAAEHHVPPACLVSAYEAMKNYSGESNPGLEDEFVSLAPSA